MDGVRDCAVRAGVGCVFHPKQTLGEACATWTKTTAPIECRGPMMDNKKNGSCRRIAGRMGGPRWKRRCRGVRRAEARIVTPETPSAVRQVPRLVGARARNQTVIGRLMLVS